MDKESMKPKLKRRKKSYRKFCDRRKNDVRNRVADGKKMMATKPLNTHSTCPSVADKSTKGQQHSSEPTCLQWTTPIHLSSAHHLRLKIYQHTHSQTPPCLSDTILTYLLKR